MKLYRSNRVERLAEALADVVSAPAGDPMAEELVIVDQSGMGRWLSMQIAQRLSVCANVRFERSDVAARRLLAAADERGAAGLEQWAPDRLAWSVLAELDASLDAPALAAVRDYLRAERDLEVTTARKQWGLSRRVARLFDRYQAHRPDLIRAWDDGAEPDDWQAFLWRGLRARIDVPPPCTLMKRWLDTAAGGPGPAIDRMLAGLPQRVCFFGLSTLAPEHLRMFNALAAFREVHFFRLMPTAPGAPVHPLTVAFGRVADDFDTLIGALDPRPFEVDDVGFEDPATTPARALQRLQSDILHGRARGRGRDGDPPAAPLADDTIALHACHSPTRQLEVLRDELLAMFDADPTLQPRHVAVLCPDVATWGPLIQSVFDDGLPLPASARQRGADWGGIGFPQIRYFVADRSLRETNPAAAAFLQALGLARSRFAASEIMELLAHEPIRRRFGLLTDDLEEIERLVVEAGIHWGRDAEHRAAEGRPDDGQNTWRFGLDRLLLGLAMNSTDRGRHRFWQGVLPTDDVEGSTASLMGRFASFAETLMETLASLERSRPLAEWAVDLGHALEALVAVREKHAWWLHQVRRALDALAEIAEDTPPTRDIPLDSVLAALEGQFEIGRASAGFVAGSVTFCALLPMRSIPFRVVCLLGMDEQAFPRRPRKLGFDRLARVHQPGDRDPRKDDRYLFLEAILAARERLLITWTGRDVHSNEPRSPAVPVAELLDALALASVAPGESLEDARARLVTQHALQPFSPREYGIGPDGGAIEARSFDRRYLEGARALLLPRTAPRPFFDGPLPEAAGVLDTITADELVRFFEKGACWYLLARVLRLATSDWSVRLEDDDPIEIDYLDRWHLGTAWLNSDPSASDDQRLRAHRGAGDLPLGTPGDLGFAEAAAMAREIGERGWEARGGVDAEPVRHAIDETIDGVRITGRVGSLYPGGLVLMSCSRTQAKHVVALWVRHLLCSLSPQFSGYSRLVGRASDDFEDEVVFRPLGPAPARVAREHLADLIAIVRAARRFPLPWSPAASTDYLSALGNGADEALAGRRATASWEQDEHAVRLLGPTPPAGRDVPGVRLPEGCDFAALATRIWLPAARRLEVEE